MHSKCARNRRFGMTLIEVVCAMAVLSMLVSATLVRGNLRIKANEVRCLQNLKESSLAFREFANDNGDLFPMQVPRSLGGARDEAREVRLQEVFQVLGDYSLKPDLIVCPADTRVAAADLSDLADSHLSYFLNVDARRNPANQPLLGDRNLMLTQSGLSDARLVLGALHFEPNRHELKWSGAVHAEQGNIGLADGSVKRAHSAQLAKILCPNHAESAALLFPR